MVTKRVGLMLFAVSAAAALSACAVPKQTKPLPTGPSVYDLSLAITAYPDIITQEIGSQSMVTVQARDANGDLVQKPLKLLSELLVNGVPVDYGTLSAKTVTIDSGWAQLTYFSPAPPPSTAASDTVVTIRFTPIELDYANATGRTVQIRLARPGIILPPPGTPVPGFFFSPESPRENDLVRFDGSQSTADSTGQSTITSYAWTFGDGAIGSGVRPTHVYTLAGSYQVTLTVKNDRGISASTAPTAVTVVAAADPTPVFNLSPTNPAVGVDVNVNAAGSSVAAGRSIAGYDWDFGDGQTGSGQTAHHAYQQARTFTIVLTVTDNTGRRSSTSKTVTVTP